MDATLAQKLADLVECYGSQSAVARALETNQPSVYRILNGKTRMPRYDLGLRIDRLHREKVLDEAV